MAEWTEGRHRTGQPMWTANDNVHVIVQMTNDEGAALFWLYKRGQKGVHKKCKTLKLAKAAVAG